MPLYELDLTVPANTPASAPVDDEVPLHPGYITGIAIQFPAGCVGMVHAQVLREGAVIMPNNANATVKGDAIVVQSEEFIDATDRPYSLIVRAWSPGTTNEHTLTFRVHLRLVPVAAPIAPADTEQLLADLQAFLGA